VTWVKTFAQALNHYDCARIAVFDPADKSLTAVLLGGISQYYYDWKSGTLIRDQVDLDRGIDGLPFIDTVSVVRRDAVGGYMQFIWPVPLPRLMGAEAVFVPAPGAKPFPNGVLDLKNLKGRTLAGYVYGGIEATRPYSALPGASTAASGRLFRIWITPGLAKVLPMPPLPQQTTPVVVAPGPRDLRTAIEAANAEFGAACGRGDARAVAAMYTEGGQLYPPNERVVAGRAAIEEFWKAAMASGVKGVELKTAEVEGLGASAVEAGTYTLYGNDGTALDRGKYLVLWKWVGTAWRLHRDCWNSNGPVRRK
jgi:ketosteroid isomerase-like protein